MNEQDMAKPIIKSLDLGSPQTFLAHVDLKLGESLFDSGASQSSEYADFDALLLCPDSTMSLEIKDCIGFEVEAIKQLEVFVSQLWYDSDQQAISAEAWQEAQKQLGTAIPLIACAISYELGAQAQGVKAQQCTHTAPALWATRYKAVYIWLRQKQKAWLVATDQQAYETSKIRILEAHASLLSKQNSYRMNDRLEKIGFVPECTFEEYEQGFEELQEAILDGEVYQMNLTIALKQDRPMHHNPTSLFQQIWPINSGQFSSLILFDQERSLLSFSPERLVKWSFGYDQSQTSWIETAPIKGTRPRQSDLKADLEELNELKISIKDQAEHVMILDLERNDLGQICKSGSVRVTQDRVARSYATVHHLVSVVRGELLDDVRLSDILQAVFPGGSVTGAPKKRAMDLIRELEFSPRGIYCGALGYLDPLGGGDLNLPIRTIFLNKDKMEYHSGGGVVADSSAAGEWSELWVKTKGFEKALYPKYN